MMISLLIDNFTIVMVNVQIIIIIIKVKKAKKPFYSKKSIKIKASGFLSQEENDRRRRRENLCLYYRGFSDNNLKECLFKNKNKNSSSTSQVCNSKPVSPFMVETYNSNNTIDTILLQKNILWIIKFILSLSFLDHFFPADKNYAIYDKVLLTIISNFEHWCHLLKDISIPFTIFFFFFNHRNLLYQKKKKKQKR